MRRLDSRIASFGASPFCDLLVVVHPADRGVVQLGDGCDMDCMVQDAVPSQVQPVSFSMWENAVLRLSCGASFFSCSLTYEIHYVPRR